MQARPHCRLFCALCFLVLTPIMASAAVIEVRQDGTGDYTTIGAALMAADAYDIIDIGPGTYAEALVVTISVTLRSSAGPAGTVLDGNYAFRPLWISGDIDCELRGLTFTRGYSDAGGAIDASGGSTVTVEDCVFLDNRSTHDAGALFARQSGTSVIVTDSVFEQNHADWNCGACGVTMGASLAFDRCTFRDNSTDVICGGVASYYASLTVENCLFVRNSGLACGAIRSYYSNDTFRHNTIHDNSSRDHGSVLIQGGPSTVFEYNIVTADRIGWGLAFTDSPCPHTCNLYYQNALGCIRDSALDASEIEADPLFCDHPLDDFNLCVLSPALAQNNPCGLMGAFSGTCEQCGPVRSTPSTWGAVKDRFR